MIIFDRVESASRLPSVKDHPGSTSWRNGGDGLEQDGEPVASDPTTRSGNEDPAKQTSETMAGWWFSWNMTFIFPEVGNDHPN